MPWKGCYNYYLYKQKLSNSGNHVLIQRIKLAPNDANLPFSLQKSTLSITTVLLCNNKQNTSSNLIK